MTNKKITFVHTTQNRQLCADSLKLTPGFESYLCRTGTGLEKYFKLIQMLPWVFPAVYPSDKLELSKNSKNVVALLLSIGTPL